MTTLLTPIITADLPTHGEPYSTIANSSPTFSAPKVAFDSYQPPHDVLLQSIKALPDAVGVAVIKAHEPLRELVSLVHEAVKKPKLTRTQAIAAAINKWALPVVQVLLGAAVLAVGVTTMEISIMVIGATMCATGIALCITLLAGCLAPHPLDRVKEFVQRRHEYDPKVYEPGQMVALDGGV